MSREMFLWDAALQSSCMACEVRHFTLGSIRGWAGCQVSYRSFKCSNKSSSTHWKFISDGALPPFVLNLPAEVTQSHHSRNRTPAVGGGISVSGFCMWKSKALLLMTSIWNACVCVFVGVLGATLGYPLFPFFPFFLFQVAAPIYLPPPVTALYGSSFTGSLRARSTTTQMTYGASFAWTQPSSQSHFIKYKSKGNICGSKSGGGSTRRCIWARGMDCIKGGKKETRKERQKGGKKERKTQIDDLLFVVRGIFGERPKEGSVACPRASLAAAAQGTLWSPDRGARPRAHSHSVSPRPVVIYIDNIKTFHFLFPRCFCVETLWSSLRHVNLPPLFLPNLSSAVL